MERLYKGHRIEITPWLDGDGWVARVFIYYQDGPVNMLLTFALNQPIETYDSVIEAALAAAQKWIDERKPGENEEH